MSGSSDSFGSCCGGVDGVSNGGSVGESDIFDSEI